MDKRTIINIIILILLIVLIALGYQFFATGQTGSPSVTKTGALADNQSSVESTADFLSIVAGLRTLRLDTSIFSNPAFAALQDFGVTLTPQPVRNSNPFIPVGGAVVPQSGATVVSTPKR